MIGRVISVKMQKSAVVLVERHKVHPIYKKSFMRSKKYLVDDQIGVSLGDIVEFVQCRPVSKNKKWKIIRVQGRDIVALGEETMKEVAQEAIAEVLSEEENKVEGSEQPFDYTQGKQAINDKGKVRKDRTLKKKEEGKA